MLTSRTRRLSLLTIAGAALASASLAPAASADTQRYASPNGSNAAECSPANPCSIDRAVTLSSTGDEVIVTPGDYHLTKTLETPAQITIHGVAGKPRPRLLFSGPAQNGVGLGYDSLLRYVEIDQAAPTTGLFSSPGRVDQVIVKQDSGGPLCATFVNNSLIRDSIVVASGLEGRAICTTALLGLSSTSSVRNVTAIASDSKGVAIHADAFGGSAKATVNLVNVIARGGQGGADLMATSSAGGATINAAHSNYGTESTSGNGDITNGGGNQLFKTPLFVNAAAGDYRQAAGSPTIDAGVNEPLNGAFDFEGDGNTRRIGTTDIGADEFPVPPLATTGPAGTVTGQSATLSGSVIANAMATSYHFEWGTTTAYGHTTPSTGVGDGLSAATATATLGGLNPGTTYHYRVVATNAGGVATGADRVFTTVGAPTQPTTSSTTPPPASPFAGVRLLSSRLTMSGRFITLKLSCPAATVGRCTGQTKLSARRPRSSSRAAARVALGRAGFSIAPGKRASVRVRVSRAGRGLLGREPRLRGNATSAARDAAGQSKTTVAEVTIRRRPR
jgi:hypothetical protein